ncbi:hypothetical protein ZWY2020_050480 [Hordeum vulgare]|nr:hypothetical protein ZWY2020_050480 [Hordeum vulgare]
MASKGKGATSATTEEKATSKRELWMPSTLTVSNIDELQASDYLPSQTRSSAVPHSSETRSTQPPEFQNLGDEEGVPASSAAPLKKLHSWSAKSLNWGQPEGSQALQEWVKVLIDNVVILVDVIHVMLHRGVQPQQARVSPLWRFEMDSEAGGP